MPTSVRSLFVLLFVAALAACSGDAPEPVIRDYGQIGGPSGTELAEDQTLHKDNGAEPQTLDPHRATGVTEGNILRDLFEPLVMTKPNGELIPGAAESWDISDDGLVYTFRMRTDGRWSNGDPVTAADFAYSFRRALDPATLSTYASILYPIKNGYAVNTGELPPSALGVAAPDERTLVIELEAPTPYFLGLLNHSMSYAVHRPSVEEHGARFARAGNLIGNGAYVLNDWVVQSHVELGRNRLFRDDANTTIERVFYYAIENAETVFKRYRADELDFTQSVPAKQIPWIRESMPDEYVQAPYLGSYYFGFNTTREPFRDNPKLRLALSMAIDREIITGKLTAAGELPAYGWVPPVQGYEPQQPEWASWTQEERNAEAQRLYKEAGYGEGNPLVVEILYNTSEGHKRISIAIASMWKQTLGVEARLMNQEWKVFLQTREQKIKTQVFRSGWIGDYNDAYTFAELLRSDSSQNDSGWSNPEYDALLDKAKVELDPQTRAEYMQQAERIMLAEAPIVPLYFYVSKHLIKPWVKGFEPNIMDHVYTKDLYILKH
jgi:oligopeptide transport system substrate-binding protein